MSIKFLESERSQTVQSANGSADIMLQKKLTLLERTEKNIVKQITVEQKTLQTKFQRKVFQSQLSRARLFGDKEEERLLRSSKGKRSLSANNSNDLRKQALFRRSRIQSEPNTRLYSAFTSALGCVEAANREPRLLPRRTKSLDDTMDLIDGSTSKSLLDRQPPDNNTDDSDVLEKKNRSPKQHISTNQQHAVHLPPIDHRPNGGMISCQQTGTSYGEKATIVLSDESKKEYNPDKDIPENKKLLALRGIGEVNKTITLVADEQNEIFGTSSFSSKVQSFCESVEPFNTGRNDAGDYYAMRIAQNRQQATLDRPPSPKNDEERKKLLGDPRIPNLTFRSLSYDFILTTGLENEISSIDLCGGETV